MNISSISYTIELQSLLDLQACLNSPDIIKRKELDGLFWRVEDFSQARAQLTTIFKEEYVIAHSEFPRSKTADALHNNVASKIRLNSSGLNHFTSYDLAPALRHFINDSCRLLEPLTAVLASKYPSIKLGRTESLNSYINKLNDISSTLNFDAAYLLELYELWNDYKHRNTPGTHTTPWEYKANLVLKPRVSPPNVLDKQLVLLKSIEVDEFVIKTTKTILVFAKSIL